MGTQQAQLGTPSRPQILFAQDNLDFRILDLAQQEPTGRQILESAGLIPDNGYSLFAIQESGDFEDVRLDEKYDLRGRKRQQFIAFLTDRDFKLLLDGSQLEWGKPIISGSALYTLAECKPEEAVFMKVEGGEDKLVEPGELIDLAKPGIEKFVKARKPEKTYEIIVNGTPKEVPAEIVSFEQIVQIAFPGQHGPNVVFSMTFRNAASVPHAGQLGPGGKVGVKHRGTVFNVIRTDKS